MRNSRQMAGSSKCLLEKNIDAKERLNIQLEKKTFLRQWHKKLLGFPDTWMSVVRIVQSGFTMLQTQALPKNNVLRKCKCSIIRKKGKITSCKTWDILWFLTQIARVCAGWTQIKCLLPDMNNLKWLYDGTKGVPWDLLWRQTFI